MNPAGVRRRAAPIAVVVAATLAATLSACSPALPDSVVPGSSVTVGWSGELTSTNAAAAPTTGNLDVAAATRARFGDVVGGVFVPDEGFGTVTITADSPFTVRYDLAEPVWSDGIPLDAADLVLAWAAASGWLDADAAGTALPDVDVPVVDEFARAIEVTTAAPVSDWQERLEVSVPAHVVAEQAFGIDDPMEAEQALLEAVEGADAEAIAAVADVWREGFAVPDDGEVPADVLLSSGPFRVATVSRDDAGQTVTLVPNAAYRGVVPPKVAMIELAPAGPDPVADLGTRLDVVQVAPVAANAAPIDALVRRDVPVTTTDDGTVWAVLLDPTGVFQAQPPRAAFLRSLTPRTMIEQGGGAWASAYTASTSMLAAPGTPAYDIVEEDAGFDTALAESDDPAAERAAAGIAAGTQVCVVYDRGSEFAAGAFAALRGSAQEAGWTAVDCGADDLAAALAQGGWDAAILRVPVPQTAADVAASWGGDAAAPLVVLPDPARDALIAELAATTDVYAAREARARVEAAIIGSAVALPIAVAPVLTLTDAAVTGVTPRSGPRAPLTWDVAQWTAVP